LLLQGTIGISVNAEINFKPEYVFDEKAYDSCNFAKTYTSRSYYGEDNQQYYNEGTCNRERFKWVQKLKGFGLSYSDIHELFPKIFPNAPSWALQELTTEIKHHIAQAAELKWTEFATKIDPDKMVTILVTLFSLLIASKSIGIFGAISNFGNRLYNNVSSYFNVSFRKMQNNPEKIIEILNDNLRVIVGQKEAKEAMIQKIASFQEEKKRARISGKKPATNCVLCLYGNSGVGKSESANIIAKSLCGTSEPIVINPSMIKIDNNKSPIEQIFGKIETVGTKGEKLTKTSPLAAQIMTNPNTVLLIEEIDKMRNFDPHATIDEFLRQILDRGYAIIDDQKLDFSNTVIIMTTNESKESLTNGVALGRQENKVDLSDKTAARTLVKRDQSLLNRFTLIELLPLTDEDYRTIITTKFNEFIKYCNDEYKIKLTITPATIEEIAKQCTTKIKGARSVNEYLEQLCAELINFKLKNKNTNKHDAVVSFHLNLDKVCIN
jgi:ATP-dependent Clp protease ATP-binding subunit ClpA